MRSKYLCFNFKKFFITFLIATLCTLLPWVSSVFAKDGGCGYFSTGVNFFNLSKLNDKLKNSGYPELSSNFWAFGGGGYGIVYNRFIIGGEGYGFGDTASNSQYKVSLGGGYGFFNFGYLLFSSSSIKLYPLLGIGGGGLTLKLIPKSNNLKFNELLSDPKRMSTLSNGFLLVNLGLGMDYLLPLAENKDGKGGVLLGIRVGYILCPAKGDWGVEDIEVSDVPSLDFSGFYFRIVIGGGGEEK